MSTRAYVSNDYSHFRGVAIYLVDQHQDGTTAIALPVELTMQTLTDNEASATQPPTFRLPEAMARALLDALAEHFGGTAEVQTLRKDYMAERARVDKLIDRLLLPKEQ